jgi:aryl-alcohol dehydrogenase-like predicted oxidoreductase
MTISYKKMLHVGLMAGLLSLNIINSAQAASRSDDQMVTGSACMVTVDDTESLKRINVQYIRLLYIDKTQPTKLHISMASNFNAGDTLQFS